MNNLNIPELESKYVDLRLKCRRSITKLETVINTTAIDGFTDNTPENLIDSIIRVMDILAVPLGLQIYLYYDNHYRCYQIKCERKAKNGR